MKACYPGADVDKLTKHIWRMYDTNNDGAIDFRELMLVLYVMSDGTAEQNLKQIFRIFDLNNDGKINHEEMEKITKDLSKLFKEEKNGLTENIFAEMDTNNDGEISEEEFIQACLSQKKMSKKLTLKIIDIFLQWLQWQLTVFSKFTAKNNSEKIRTLVGSEKCFLMKLNHATLITWTLCLLVTWWENLK